MKKLILLLLIILLLPIIIIEDKDKNYEYYNNNYPDLTKDKNWERVKQSLFSQRFNPNMSVQKFRGPILISLPDATPKDSLLVDYAIQNLKKLLPNKKVDYFENFIKNKENKTIIKDYNLQILKDLRIKIYFKDSLKINKNLLNKKEIETNIDSEYSYFTVSFEKTPKLSGFFNPTINLDFKEDSSIEKRQRIIEFGLIKILACKSEFLGLLDMYELSTKSEQRLDEVRFLLEKLYTPNILQDFKTYLYKAYSWRYASNYLSKSKTKIIALWLSISLAILMSLLGFSILYKREFNYKYLNYFLPTFLYLLIVVYSTNLYRFITAQSNFENWKMYLNDQFATISIATLASLSLFLFDKYFVKTNMTFTMQLILKAGFTFLILLFPLITSTLIQNSEKEGWSQIIYQSNTILIVIFIFTVGRTLFIYLEHFTENLVKQKDIELSQLKELNAQAEINLLQSQVNPHFLYNALNSIASLAQIDCAKTELMALSLSGLFKYTINRKGEKNNTIADEVEMVKNYLEVEKIRFGERLNFNVKVDKKIENTKIPMFLIQPLIENAIKHGISKIEKNGEIHLIIQQSKNNILITVKDNGPDFPEDIVSGYGLQTVYDLLELSYKKNASLSWNNSPEKKISITLKKNN